MVFKRYIKRGGKVYGPYYYESYRDKSGKVHKKYCGTTEGAQKKEKTPSYSYIHKKHFLVLCVCSFLLVGLFLFVLSFNSENNVEVGGVTFLLQRGSISGFIVSEFGEEPIAETFDNEVDLTIKEPVSVLGQEVSSNTNERMDFDVPHGLRIYFTLLNQTAFIEQAVDRYALANNSVIPEKNET